MSITLRINSINFIHDNVVNFHDLFRNVFYCPTSDITTAAITTPPLFHLVKNQSLFRLNSYISTFDEFQLPCSQLGIDPNICMQNIYMSNGHKN